MEFHTREMFLSESIKDLFVDDLNRKETLEYKLKFLNDQIINVKKEHFNELFVYETMKKTNSNLIPNKEILIQIKSLERNPTYLGYKRETEEMALEIKKIDNMIEKKVNEASKNFSFISHNLLKYGDLMEDYLNNKSEVLFNQMMEFIFNIEFNDKILYRKLRIEKNYDIFNLLLEKAPTDYQPMFKYMILEIQYYDYQYEKKLISMGIIKEPQDIVIQMFVDHNKLLEEIE